MRSGYRALTVLLLSCFVFTDSAAGAGNDPASVDKQKATVEYKSYDPAHPPADVPQLTPDEAGVTVSLFSCSCAVRGTVVDQSRVNGITTATVRVDSAQVVLRLTITVWVASNAAAKTHDHEAGHRDIALDFYTTADQAASAHALIGQTFTGTGKAPGEASKAALTAAANGVDERYTETVSTPCGKVQDIYDRITAHGTNNIKEADAIKQAKEEAKKAADDKQ